MNTTRLLSCKKYPLLFSCPLLRPSKTSWRERERERESRLMETIGFYCCSRSFVSPLVSKSQATQKPGNKISAEKKDSIIIPLGKPGLRQTNNNATSVKLLSNVEKLRLLTKAEKAGLLSLAESFGLSLSTVERLGLLSKAEELGVLSAATDQSTPSALLTLSLALLVLGPAFVYLVPEENAWEVALQIVVALVCVVSGSAAFAVSNFVSNLQKSS